MKLSKSDKLSAQSILFYLPEDIKDEMQRRILFFDCLESTNITAKDLAAAGAEHGTVIIADYQTAGKGCRGKTFFSPAGCGIYMSFILDAGFFDFENPASITASAAVSVCRAIETATGKFPRVKKINDIFLDGKKICGILTESVIGAESHNINFIVLGIGINFNTPVSRFPEELQGIAGSLFESETPPVSRNELTAEIITSILYPKVKFDEEQMLEEYNKRLL